MKAMKDLAALLHPILTNRLPCVSPDCDERHFDYCRHETDDIAARLMAAGVRVAPTRDEIDSLLGEEGRAQPGRAARHLFHPLLASPDHILTGLMCWCRPYRDPEEHEVIIHRRPAS